MDDGSIISLFLERSENAIHETKIKYGRLVVSTAMRILGNQADAEECENDTYMGVWSAIPPQRPLNFKTFLLKIARNQALKRYHFLNAEKRNPNVEIPLEELYECADESTSAAYSDDALAEIMNGFLALLNEETRRVFMLRYWYFASVKEITEECGISKSKAESMLFRTRKKLKKYLEEKGVRQ
ncbi:MAG: sigma-70 family RNA polymerase sigma factor [Oscillospiraceae bacterium]|nr:sigma-70 family RNA polymerase sigma factor [Oscillospiraceae bacterium]